jgi:hypothetical protein
MEPGLHFNFSEMASEQLHRYGGQEQLISNRVRFKLAPIRLSVFCQIQGARLKKIYRLCCAFWSP